MLKRNICYLCGAMKAWRVILASIVICFMYVCLQKTDNFASENVPAKDSCSEITTSAMDFSPTAHASFSFPEMRCRSSRSSSARNTSRIVSQTSRHGGSYGQRAGFTLKNSCKSLHNHTSTIFFISLMAFPSGIDEVHHHLACLRKFII